MRIYHDGRTGKSLFLLIFHCISPSVIIFKSKDAYRWPHPNPNPLRPVLCLLLPADSFVQDHRVRLMEGLRYAAGTPKPFSPIDYLFGHKYATATAISCSIDSNQLLSP